VRAAQQREALGAGMPTLASTGRDAIHWQRSHAARGRFTRFMQPGAQRMLCAVTRKAQEGTAAINPDGSLAVVALNRGDHVFPFALRLATRHATLTADAHALLTVQVAGAEGCRPAARRPQ
jgi:glucosylceramidase